MDQWHSHSSLSHTLDTYCSCLLILLLIKFARLALSWRSTTTYDKADLKLQIFFTFQELYKCSNKDCSSKPHRISTRKVIQSVFWVLSAVFSQNPETFFLPVIEFLKHIPFYCYLLGSKVSRHPRNLYDTNIFSKQQYLHLNYKKIM